MQVVKRDGNSQNISFDKVLDRIKNLCNLDEHDTYYGTATQALRNVNYDDVARKVIGRIYDGIHTNELDEIAAAICQPMVMEHREYGELAARLLISNHHKNCDQLLLENFMAQLNPDEIGPNDLASAEAEIQKYRFYHTCLALWENIDINGNRAPMIAPHIMKFVEQNPEALEELLDYNKDYIFNYAGFEMLYGQYLLQCSLQSSDGYLYKELEDGQKILARFPIERPQHMWLRVALGIWLKYPEQPYRDQWEQAKHEGLDQTSFWNTLKENSDLSDPYIAAMIGGLDLAYVWGRIEATYHILSKGLATHATPTLFHSGGVTPQMSSCFLQAVKDDSLIAIAHWNESNMMISKVAGGLGSHVHNIRPEGSYIAGTGGTSNGLVPMLRVTNEISKYVDQGGSKRPGSHAIYLEPWHGDIEAFLDLRRPRGNQELRAKALFTAVWINDEFMRTIEQEERIIQTLKPGEPKPKLWYLMDPSRCPGLPDKYDEELRLTWISDEELQTPDASTRWAFTNLYRKYIRENRFMRRISAVDLWKQICDLTEESSIPYKVHKDACNRKSNQKNVGTIKSSNLCCEIIEYSDAQETAVCNLASICLNRFITSTRPLKADLHPYANGFLIDTDLVPKKLWFDFDLLDSIVQDMVINLDRIIDQNYYPTPETKRSNMRHRPIGVGVQGLADCYARLWLPFDSDEALKLNFYIFETMDYAMKTASHNLALKFGSYSSFQGSPASKGLLQIDLWQNEQAKSDQKSVIPDWTAVAYKPWRNWDELRSKCSKALRNSLGLAPMPTASTSTLTGNSPAFEPHNAMVYKRKDKFGESFVCNIELMNILQTRGLWTSDVRNQLLKSRTGSIQGITQLPKWIRDIFKNAWDMSPKVIINQSLVRGPFVDQSQSMNLFIEAPTHRVITQMHFYSWKRGIKTGCYYLRRLPPADAKKIQLVSDAGNRSAPLQQNQTKSRPNTPGKSDDKKSNTQDEDEEIVEICTMKEGCIQCSS